MSQYYTIIIMVQSSRNERGKRVSFLSVVVRGYQRRRLEWAIDAVNENRARE